MNVLTHEPRFPWGWFALIAVALAFVMAPHRAPAAPGYDLDTLCAIEPPPPPDVRPRGSIERHHGPLVPDQRTIA